MKSSIGNQSCGSCHHRYETSGGCTQHCANRQYGHLKFTPDHNPILQQGWLCPRCNTILSPHTKHCMCERASTLGKEFDKWYDKPIFIPEDWDGWIDNIRWEICE